MELLSSSLVDYGDEKVDGTQTISAVYHVIEVVLEVTQRLSQERAMSPSRDRPTKPSDTIDATVDFCRGDGSIKISMGNNMEFIANEVLRNVCSTN